MIAALFVQYGGVYYGRDDVEPWGWPNRDAREYEGPHPVVAHPPCARWSRYWFGGPSAKERRKLGDDGGCFAAAIKAVRTFGGVLEHPEASHAWRTFGLAIPPKEGGWIAAGDGGHTCCVEQGHYGHRTRKATWLYAHGLPSLPELKWGPSPWTAKIDHGFHSAEERARFRAGLRQDRGTPPAEQKRSRDLYESLTGKKHFARVGKRELSRTPLPFRDLLISIASSTREPIGDPSKTSPREASKR